jgi:hypothetical protein
MVLPHAEHRKSSRHAMHRAAEIIFGENPQPIRCRIWDMSEEGARLALPSPVANIPHHFTLVLFKDASVRRDCELVWTDHRYIGIKFLSRWY